MKRMLSVLIVAALLLGSASLFAAPKELSILWAQWDPADYLQQLNNEYQKATGISVKVVQEPWGSFGDRFYTAMAAKGTEWDMVIGDSQWLGTGAVSGQYIELTDWMNKNNLVSSVTPATLKYYGEYPARLQEVLGIPDRGRCVRFRIPQGPLREPRGEGQFQEEIRLRAEGPRYLEAVQGHRGVLHPAEPGYLGRSHLHAEGL